MSGRFLSIVVLLFVLVALCLAPAIAEAETVGLIMTHGVYDFEKIHESLTKNLEKRGYSGRVKFLTQRPYPDPIAISNAARKLLAADVDIIITYGSAPTVAMLRERPRIPVLYAGVYDHIAEGLKSKWATGVCSKLNVSSLVRYLRASKTIKTLGVVHYSLEKESSYQLQEIKEISEKYGLKIETLDLKQRANLSLMLNDTEADALIITSSLPAGTSLPTIVRISSTKKIPTAALMNSDNAMAMITLTTDAEEQGRLLANMLIQLLDGKSIQQVEAACCRKIELIYNVKDANRMGLKISMDLITEATKLINK